jgi:acetylornithine/succinyldiaminopimelate/putrescine aminotransferase
MLAIATDDGPALARRLLLEQRLVAHATDAATVRFLPPLTVSEEQIDDAVARIAAALGG